MTFLPLCLVLGFISLPLKLSLWLGLTNFPFVLPLGLGFGFVFFVEPFTGFVLHIPLCYYLYPPIFVTPSAMAEFRSHLLTTATPTPCHHNLSIPPPSSQTYIYLPTYALIPHPSPWSTHPSYPSHPLLFWFLSCAAAVEVAMFAWVHEIRVPFACAFHLPSSHDCLLRCACVGFTCRFIVIDKFVYRASRSL